jgi:predicted nucleic acid-binding protein
MEEWRRLDGEAVSTEGVLVEAAHLLRKSPRAQISVIALSISLPTRFVPATAARIQRALELMARYRDVPMDLVDAHLVAIAEEEQIDRIFTLDRRGFLTFRRRGGRRFQVLPE